MDKDEAKEHTYKALIAGLGIMAFFSITVFTLGYYFKGCMP